MLQAGHDSLDILHGDRVHTGERFVEHDKLRVDSQATGNFRTATFPTRKLVAQVLAHFVQTKLSQETLQLLLLVFRSRISHLQHRAEVIFHSHLPKDRSLLCQIANAVASPPVNRELRDVHIIEENTSLVRRNQAHSHIESCRLTSSIRSQQADNLPLFDID